MAQTASQPVGSATGAAASAPRAAGFDPRPGGSFQSATAPASMPAAEPLSQQEQARYDAVALALTRALNAEDNAAYRALHTDAGWNEAIDWWRDMFAAQRARFGPIVRVYPCVRGVVRFGRMGYRGDLPSGATFVVRFEETCGGALSIQINAEGKIEKSSVFIKEELVDYDAAGAKPIYER